MSPEALRGDGRVARGLREVGGGSYWQGRPPALRGDGSGRRGAVAVRRSARAFIVVVQEAH